MSPVGIFGFFEPFAALRRRTVPVAAMTIFRPRRFRFARVPAGETLLVEHDLRDAGAVAHVEKNEVAVVAAAIDPAHEGNGGSGVGGAEVSAEVRVFEGTEEIEGHSVFIVRSLRGLVRFRSGRIREELLVWRMVSIFKERRVHARVL